MLKETRIRSNSPGGEEHYAWILGDLGKSMKNYPPMGVSSVG